MECGMVGKRSAGTQAQNIPREHNGMAQVYRQRTTAMSTDTLLQEAKLFQGIAGSFHFLL